MGNVCPPPHTHTHTEEQGGCGGRGIADNIGRQMGVDHGKCDMTTRSMAGNTPNDDDEDDDDDDMTMYVLLAMCRLGKP